MRSYTFILRNTKFRDDTGVYLYLQNVSKRHPNIKIEQFYNYNTFKDEQDGMFITNVVHFVYSNFKINSNLSQQMDLLYLKL